jgi:hypothetical protein
MAILLSMLDLWTEIHNCSKNQNFIIPDQKLCIVIYEEDYNYARGKKLVDLFKYSEDLNLDQTQINKDQILDIVDYWHLILPGNITIDDVVDYISNNKIDYQLITTFQIIIRLIDVDNKLFEVFE